MNITIKAKHNNLALVLMTFTCLLIFKNFLSLRFRIIGLQTLLSGFFYCRYYMLALPMSLGTIMFAVNRLWGESGSVYAPTQWKRNNIRPLLLGYSGTAQTTCSHGGYSKWLLIIALVMLELFAAELTTLVMPHYYGFVLGRYGSVISIHRPYRPALWLLLTMAVVEETGWRAYFQNMLIDRLGGRAAWGILITSMLLSAAFVPLRSSMSSMPIDVILWDYLFVLTGNILLGTLFHRTKNLNTIILAHMAAIMVPYVYLKILMMR